MAIEVRPVQPSEGPFPNADGWQTLNFVGDSQLSLSRRATLCDSHLTISNFVGEVPKCASIRFNAH